MQMAHRRWVESQGEWIGGPPIKAGYQTGQTNRKISTSRASVRHDQTNAMRPFFTLLWHQEPYFSRDNPLAGSLYCFE
jgi:hypothetical protein